MSRTRLFTMLGGMTAAGLLIAGSSVLSPLAAQSAQGSSSAAPVCMVRMIDGNLPFPIILPATDIDAMLAKGFEPTPCKRDFETTEQREAWKETICEMASIRIESVHENFEEKWGERPNVLCGMAEQASSQWKRGGRQ